MTEEQRKIIRNIIKENGDYLLNLSNTLSSRILTDSEMDILDEYGDRIEQFDSLLKGFERECKIDEILDDDREEEV